MAPSRSIGCVLTRERPVEFRVDVPGTTWSSSLEEAVRGFSAPRQPLAWPSTWQAFSRGAAEPDLPALESLTTQPTRIFLGGEAIEPLAVPANSEGILDFEPVFGPAKSRKWALLCAEVDLAAAATLHFGADWWMRVWVDGQAVFDTFEHGNRAPVTDRAFELSVPAGRHFLAIEVVSGNGGWKFASEATAATRSAAAFGLLARRQFQIDDVGTFREFALTDCLPSPPLVNGEIPTLPMPGLRYRTLPLANSLPAGENTLSRQWSPEQTQNGLRSLGLRIFRHSGPGSPLEFPEHVVGYSDDDLALATGPILANVSTDSLTLTARTTLRSRLAVRIGQQIVTTARGHFHRATVTGLEPGTAYDLEICAKDDGRILCADEARTLPKAETLTIAVAGDPSPVPKVWRNVAARLAAADANLTIFLGDATSHGRDDWRWDEEFFGPATALFARTPVLAVPGNHDEGSPLFDAFFGHGTTPEGFWSLPWNRAIFLGLVGDADWTPGRNAHAWLQAQLAAHRDKMAIVCTHYPPYSSTPHGAENANGEPVEPPVHAARANILPLLQEHRSTLLLTGHAHCYERSEIFPNVTLVTSGGGGGYLYQATPDEPRNPFSTRFVSEHHTCVLTLSPELCRIDALDLDGNSLDERVWSLVPTATTRFA